MFFFQNKTHGAIRLTRTSFRFFAFPRPSASALPVYQLFPTDASNVATSEHAALETVLRREMSARRVDDEQTKLSKCAWRLIRAKKEQKSGEYIDRIWKDMKLEGVAPNLSLFDLLINAVSRSGRIDLAHEFYREMVESYKIEPTVELLTYMINVCKYSVEPERAQQYMDTLLSMIAAATSTAEVKSGANGANGGEGANDEGANNSATSSSGTSSSSSGTRGKKLVLKNSMFNQLINVYARAGQETGALNTFRQMKEFGLKPDVFTYGALVKLYSRQHRLSDALAVVEQMKQQGEQEAQGSTLVVGTPIYNMLIQACKMPEQRETALALFDEMQQVGVARDSMTYGTIINKLVQASEYRAAHAMYRKMKELRIPTTPFIYNCLVRACVEQAKAIDSFTFPISPPVPSSSLAPIIKNNPGRLVGKKVDMMKRIISTARAYTRDAGNRLECKPLVQQLEEKWKTMRDERNKLWAKEYKQNLKNDKEYMIHVRTTRGLKLEEESTKRREAKKKREEDAKLARQKEAARRQEHLLMDDELDK